MLLPLSTVVVLRSAALALTATSQVELRPIFTAGEKNAAGFPVFGYRIPGFVAAGANASRGDNVTLVVLAEARKYSCSDEGAHDLVAKRSTSAGHSWGPSQTVIDPAKLWGAQEGGKHGGAVYDPTPVYDETTGKIHVVFSYCPARYMSRPPISQAFELWEVISEDLGATWGAPRNLSAILPSKQLAPNEPKWCIRTGAGGGNGIQLAHGPNAGRLVVPGYHSFCPLPPPPPPAPSPSCTPAKAQAMADTWCNRPGTWCDAPGSRVALKGEGKTGPTGGMAWRCYSPKCLTPDKKSYRNGSRCIDYCTENAQLSSIIETCSIAPTPPPPRASESHVLISDDHGETWTLGGSFLPGSGEGSVAEIGPSSPGELVFIARRVTGTHCTDPTAAHCVGAARSTDSGLHWIEASEKDVGALPDPGCKNTVASVGTTGTSTGNNLLVHAGSHSVTARTNVSAIFSRDAGKTWDTHHSVMVWAAPNVGGYVAVQALGDSVVGVVFENNTCSIAIGVIKVP